MIEFDWEEKKNKANRNKHGIWFEEARQVFEDPLAIRYFDSTHSSHEDRFLLVGESEPNRVLLIVFCERSGLEKKKYEKGI